METDRLERLHTCLFRLLMMVLVVIGGLIALYFYQGGWERMQQSRFLARVIPDLFHGPRVAIISGHRGFDSGAMCEDGTMEAAVNEAIAQGVAQRLRKAGVAVILLDEYDPRLEGLRARALVSIHADSCIDQSGFKVAGPEETVIPDQDALLTACLIDAYARGTGLPARPQSITQDMTQYHAFQRVSPQTPGAIIEVGYLGGDHDLLVNHPEIPAEAIAQGVLCFLDAQDRAQKTPTVP